MLNCERLCIKCSNTPNTILNYIKVHGVCEKHLIHLDEFEKCVHCTSIVPVIYSSFEKSFSSTNDFTCPVNIANGLSDSTAYEPKIIMFSSSQRIKCDYCSNESELSESFC